jgi:glucose/arabinose dehydrogenase
LLVGTASGCVPPPTSALGAKSVAGAASISDTVPPTAPGGARTGELTCRSVTFSWNAATDNVGVAFYDVYHDGQLMTSVGGMTLSVDLTVVPGVTWGLYVNARDAAGNVSQASTTVPISPPQCGVDAQAPTAPRQLTGTASGTTAMLRWVPSTDNVGVRYYDVYRNATRVGTITGSGSTPPATSFIDSGLATRTSYQYYVVARDAQLNVSSSSNLLTATTGSACINPVCGVTRVTTDTDIPWGLVTLPEGTVLYSRRDAHTIVHLNPATGAKTTVGTVPNVDETDGEGGLLGLAISPTFSTDHWLYIMHTSPTDNRIVRIRVDGNVLNTASEQVLLKGILRNKYHNGGRLRFGPDGKLYAATGDAQNGANAQNISGLNGKVLRLNPDGSVPSDNPFGNFVWSYGHRNPQGLAFDSQGRLWEQEFGNSVMDETNLILRGGNYGWPACEGTAGTCNTPGFIAPKQTYPTAEGSCSGIAIVHDVLYIACERGTRVYREVISGTSLTDVAVYFNGTYGRLRTVEPAPDGGLWLTTTTVGDKDGIADNSNEKILHVALGDVTGASLFTAVMPTQLYDSGTVKIGTAPVALAVAGRAGVPTNATGAAVTVQVVHPTAAANLIVAPYQSASAVGVQQFSMGQTISQTLIVPLHLGHIQLRLTAGAARVIVSIAGYITTVSGSPFTAMAATPVYDSVTATVGTIPVRVHVAGRGGVPVGAMAVALTVEVVHPTAAGNLIVAPYGSSTSIGQQQFGTNRTISQTMIAPLNSGDIQLRLSAGKARIIVSVSGYMTSPAGSQTTAIGPNRLYDSATPRIGTSSNVLQVAGHAGVPTAAKAVALLVEVVHPSVGANLLVAPCGAAARIGLQQFAIDQAISEMVIVPLRSAAVQFRLSAGKARVIVSVVGYLN